MDSSHLLRAAGQACCSPAVLLRIEFTAALCLQAPGELLPRLSTLTVVVAKSAKLRFRLTAKAALTHLHWQRGGISLLHWSWSCLRRALPVILALRSPDFPRKRPFGASSAAARLTYKIPGAVKLLTIFYAFCLSLSNLYLQPIFTDL